MSTKTTIPSLLFINHDAKHRKTQSHRRAVFAHVQRSYKRWQQEEDTQALRNSAKLPHFGGELTVLEQRANEKLGLPLEHLSPRKVTQDSTFINYNADHRSTTDQDLKIINSYVAKQHHARHKGESQAVHCDGFSTFLFDVQTPVSVLRKGNSDPFQAFAIPIDPKVSHAMNYFKDMFLPGVFNDANNLQVRNAIAHDFTAIISFLEDESTAYAHLARVVAAMPKSESNTGVVSQSLVFRTKGMAALRKRLANKDAAQDQRTWDSILLLLAAENYDENSDAALFHARMIAYLLKNSKVAVNEFLLFKAVYNDVQRASLSLSRPCFDFDEWLPQKFEPLHLKANKAMPEDDILEACEMEIDDSIMNPVVRDIMIQLHYLNASSVMSYTDQDFAKRDTMPYMRCRVVMTLGRLINHYLDSIETMENVRRPELVWAARVEAYTCLSQIYLLRCRGKLDTFHIGKQLIFSANPRILRKMQDLLKQDESNIEGKYARLKLSALYTGAWAEQATVAKTHTTAENGWFNVKLATQAARMGLESWSEVREVLLGFGYSETLEPNGGRWFRNAVAVNYSGSIL